MPWGRARCNPPFVSARGLGDGHGIGAASHHVGNCISEAVADILDAAIPTGVFACIVQQRADGFILICTMLQRDTHDTEEVGEIGDLCVLALLVGVDEHGVVQGLVEF